jgi:prevent-host-death family protein
MPIIKPITDLRNKSKEISELAHNSKEPIFITRDGEGDLVVMSLAYYGQMEKRLELYGKLAAAQKQAAAGDKGKPLNQVMRELRKKIHESS